MRRMRRAHALSVRGAGELVSRTKINGLGGLSASAEHSAIRKLDRPPLSSVRWPVLTKAVSTRRPRRTQRAWIWMADKGIARFIQGDWWWRAGLRQPNLAGAAGRVASALRLDSGWWLMDEQTFQQAITVRLLRGETRTSHRSPFQLSGSENFTSGASPLRMLLTIAKRSSSDNPLSLTSSQKKTNVSMASVLDSSAAILSAVSRCHASSSSSFMPL